MHFVNLLLLASAIIIAAFGAPADVQDMTIDRRTQCLSNEAAVSSLFNLAPWILETHGVLTVLFRTRKSIIRRAPRTSVGREESVVKLVELRWSLTKPQAPWMPVQTGTGAERLALIALEIILRTRTPWLLSDLATRWYTTAIPRSPIPENFTQDISVTLRVLVMWTTIAHLGIGSNIRFTGTQVWLLVTPPFSPVPTEWFLTVAVIGVLLLPIEEKPTMGFTAVGLHNVCWAMAVCGMAFTYVLLCFMEFVLWK
jgi:hypothetical protein